MLEVVCVNAGNYLGRGVEYVRTLNDMVRRALPAGYVGRFTVFTDTPGDYGPEIAVRDMPATWLHGWWHKLSLFKAGVFERGTHVLYLDLDTVITGRMDAVADYRGEFAILRDFFRPGGWQSSVMAWTASETTEAIWGNWIAVGSPEIVGGDQAWIEKAVATADLWQDVAPDAFVSYKLSGGAAPDRAAIVVFHGLPRPHEVLSGWVPMVWKEGGMTRAELDAVCNTAIEAVHDNIRSACALDLPWFDFDWGDTHEAQVCIVGGAPSLVAEIETIRWRQGLGQKVWALNGSFDFLMANGIWPDAHVIIDARPENVAFLSDPWCGTKYYLASQCDPSLFAALEGFDVTLFHCQSEGVAELLKDEKARPVHLLGAGTTVAMKAMLLAELGGCRTLHLIGVDSCYTGDRHHAYEQGANDGEILMDVVYGERDFKCAPWMVGQANDFVEYAQRFDGIMTVAGEGLLAHIARTGLPESAVDIRAREILARLPEADEIKGAEIGVFGGDLSQRLLAAKPGLTLHLVDSWGDYEPTLEESGDFHATLTAEAQEQYFAKTTDAVSSFSGRAVIHRAKSVAAANTTPDGLDFVFIDADHSYDGCRSDIEAWARKLRPGGLLSGHDYDNVEFPQWGVKRAVDEFVAANDLTLDLGENFTWFVTLKGA